MNPYMELTLKGFCSYCMFGPCTNVAQKPRDLSCTKVLYIVHTSSYIHSMDKPDLVHRLVVWRYVCEQFSSVLHIYRI